MQPELKLRGGKHFLVNGGFSGASELFKAR